MPSYITEAEMRQEERQAEIDQVSETDLIVDALERWLSGDDDTSDYRI